MDTLKKNNKYLILLALISCMLVSCARRINRNIYAKKLTQKLSQKDVGKYFNLLDPLEAKVTTFDVEVDTEVYGDAFSVPSFKIAYDKNSYVQILRCQSYLYERREEAEEDSEDDSKQDTKFSESSKEDLSKSEDDNDVIAIEGNKEIKRETGREAVLSRVEIANKGGFEDLKWLWIDLTGDQQLCKVAAMKSMEQKFVDIAAPSGSFFYVVNPCVSADVSTTKRDECSYKLSLTQSISHKNEFSVEMLKRMSELKESESKYDALVYKLSLMANRLADAKRNCEEKTRSSSKSGGGPDVGDIITMSIVGAGIAVSGARAYRTNKSMNAFLYPSAVFASAGALSMGIRRATSGASDTQEVIKECSNAETEEILSSIESFRESGVIEKAKEDMILKSKAVSELDKTFVSYDKVIEKLSGSQKEE